ncbi:hypothetical protein RHO14_10500 [Orbus wheelerorum]|uniref:glycoside hydrolase family 19 protein n=1 Tax=Orbus wheelerorum TaxID=3074111 RepID=UPI00370D89B0
MTIKKITNFVFPVGNKELSQNAYYRALSDAKSGFYPFGENGLWHGGIHIDDGVFKTVNRNDNKIRCMANGEVIAYRVNSVYPKVTYNENPAVSAPLRHDRESVAYFSTGFTLVRHYFVMPKVAGETDSPPSITLYSLYMHQLDWYGYQQLAKENQVVHPNYWHLTSGRVSNQSKDRIKGTIVRQNGPKTTGVALLLKGSKIKLGDQIGKTGWYKLESIVEGGLVNNNGTFHSDLVLITGYVFGKEIGTIESEPQAHKNTVYTVNKENNDKIGSPEATVAGIAVYANQDGKEVLAYLPKATLFVFDGQENGYAKIKKIEGNYVPSALKVESSERTESPHKGWVKISNLISLDYQPKEFDKVVVLDTPAAISGGDFIGYLGHNVSRNGQFLQPKTPALATQKRPSDERLIRQGHFELFTGDDLPSFITKTRALADKLPESEKTLILVEKGAQLINESASDELIQSGRWINVMGSVSQSCYVKAFIYYKLSLNRYQCTPDNVITPTSLKTGELDTIGISQPVHYRLTADDKAALIRYYQIQYPELTVANIPDTVELIGYTTDSPFENNGQLFTLDRETSYLDNVEIRFNLVGDKPRWVKSLDVIHLGRDGQLNQSIISWSEFPLTLANLPTANDSNTVYYPLTLPLASIKAENHIAIDDNATNWAYITTGNLHGEPIKGWVNISKGESEYLQPHIKRVSPWAWTDFDTVKETASIANMVEKLQTNRKMTLDLNDYSESMIALHYILTDTPLNKNLPYVLPPFTHKQLQMGLQTPWTAEMIGRLAINYESEWYADDSLSKWNEIDTFYQKQTEQKRQSIIDELTKAGITQPAAHQHACKILDEKSEYQLSEWQLEKQQRIKPSLWWSEVAKAQAVQVASNTTTNTASTNQPVLSSLPASGKVWYLHPVGMREFVISDLLITMEMLLAAHPSGSKAYYNEILPSLNQYAVVYKLTEAKEIAHFLSQIAHESGFRIINEDLGYTAHRMKLKLGCKKGETHYNEKTDSCDLGQLRPKLWTNTAYYEKNPEHLGNYVYANRMGNGDESSGDGYRYRGRGVIQLTGKDAYRNFTRVHNRNNPDDIQDFVANPDLLISSMQYGIESAFVFWFTKTGKPNPTVNTFVNLRDLAKSGTVQEVTQLVNGGQNGYIDRKQRFNRIARLFGLREEE